MSLCRMVFCTDNNLYITPQAGQAFEHFGFADTAKLTPQHSGYFRLRHAKHFCCLHLAPLASFDDVAD